MQQLVDVVWIVMQVFGNDAEDHEEVPPMRGKDYHSGFWNISELELGLGEGHLSCGWLINVSHNSLCLHRTFGLLD